jgi:hypothetical protein
MGGPLRDGVLPSLAMLQPGQAALLSLDQQARGVPTGSSSRARVSINPVIVMGELIA